MDEREEFSVALFFPDDSYQRRWLGAEAAVRLANEIVPRVGTSNAARGRAPKRMRAQSSRCRCRASGTKHDLLV
jgi:hypothetical protein